MELDMRFELDPYYFLPFFAFNFDFYKIIE
jgi:hypothetical protein